MPAAAGALISGVLEIQHLAQARATVLDEAKRNGVSERRAHSARGHEADAAAAPTIGDDGVRARWQHALIQRPQADELATIPAHRILGEERAVATVGVVPFLTRPTEADILRHRLAVGIGADDDEALLEPEHG